jgi:hypothetical protein
VGVEPGTTPVRVLSATGRIAGDDVRLDWSLADPLPVAVRWRRGPERSSAIVVAEGWQAAALVGTLIDPGGRSLLPAVYWLEGLERDGTVEAWGPLPVAATVSAPGWRALPNPARADVAFSWGAPLPQGSMLEVFDLAGRRVHRAAPSAGAHTLDWNGRDERGVRAAPGIYFARLTGSGLPPLRLVRLP